MKLIRQGSSLTDADKERKKREQLEKQAVNEWKQRRGKSKYKPPRQVHGCAGAGCDAIIQTRWKYCRKCSGLTRKRRRNDLPDAMEHRVPGSFESGKRR